MVESWNRLKNNELGRLFAYLNRNCRCHGIRRLLAIPHEFLVRGRCNHHFSSFAPSWTSPVRNRTCRRCDLLSRDMGAIHQQSNLGHTCLPLSWSTQFLHVLCLFWGGVLWVNHYGRPILQARVRDEIYHPKIANATTQITNHAQRNRSAQQMKNCAALHFLSRNSCVTIVVARIPFPFFVLPSKFVPFDIVVEAVM